MVEGCCVEVGFVVGVDVECVVGEGDEVFFD